MSVSKLCAQEQPNSCMPPYQFEAYVAWPGDKYYVSEGAGPTNEEGPSTTINEDFNY